MSLERLSIIDSHTGGEPTRLVISGMPDLGGGTVAAQCDVFREKFDHYRSAIVQEPRGSDVMVGALLVPPSDPTCQFGVIFFNDVGPLGMCGHGTIGVVASLAHMGKLGAGTCRIETTVGPVSATRHADGSVSIENVPSRRVATNVAALHCHGDVVWSGNWFFLCADHGMDIALDHVAALTEFSLRLRDAVHLAGFNKVDHVELFGPARQPGHHSKNFVLCPGGAYDRSPCGTGTSAKLAALAAAGKLAPGETWHQESIIGSVFTGTYRWEDETTEPRSVIPTITGTAHVNAEATLLLDPSDPFCWGIRDRTIV
jgi:4-hydroxyproline epimerase